MSVRVDDFQVGNEGYLAKAYGRHNVAGHLAEHKTVVVGSSTQIYISVLLGTGEWEGLERVTYDGLDVDGYHFYHGVLKANYVVDEWFPNSLQYNGVARYTAKLPLGAVVDDVPNKMVCIAKTSKVYIYDANGNATWYGYTDNPADHFVDLVKINCEKLGLPLTDYVHWQSYVEARNYFAELIPQSNYSRVPTNFMVNRESGGSIPDGTYYVSVQGFDGSGYSMRAGETAVTLGGGYNRIDAICDVIEGITQYRFWIRNAAGNYYYTDATSSGDLDDDKVNECYTFMTTLGNAGTPQTAGGSFLSNLPRFASNAAFPQPVNLAAALNKIMWNCCGDWSRESKRYVIRTPQSRSALYLFDASNTITGGFKYYRTPVKDRTNRVIVKFRDTMDKYLSKGEQESFRDTSIARVGLNKEEIQLDGLTHNQAYRTVNYRIRTQHDLNEWCEIIDDGRSAQITPGDIVLVTDSGADWVNKLMVVVDTEDSDSDSIDNRKHILKGYSPSLYSESDSAPISSTAPSAGVPTSKLVAPPAIVGIDLAQNADVKDDGTVIFSVVGVVNFRSYGGGSQRGFLYHTPPNSTPTLINTLLPLPTTNAAGFKVDNLTIGTHIFKAVVFNEYGVGQTDAVQSYSINVSAVSVSKPQPPVNLGAVFNGDVIRWSWERPSDKSVAFFRIKSADGGRTFADTDSTSYDDIPVSGTTVYTRRIYAVNKYGLESATYATFTIDISTYLPPPPPNYSLDIRGRELTHLWTGGHTKGTYQISANNSFSTILYEGLSNQFIEALGTPTSRSITRYIRATDNYKNAGEFRASTVVLPVPVAPTLTKDNIRQYPTSLIVHVATTTPKVRILATIVQVKPAGGAYPVSTAAGIDGNYRFEGVPGEILIPYSAGGVAEFRIAHEDIYTTTLIDHQWSTLAHAFPQFAESDIADGAIVETKIADAAITNAKIRNLTAGKIVAETADAHIIFADYVGSRNYVPAGAKGAQSYITTIGELYGTATYDVDTDKVITTTDSPWNGWRAAHRIHCGDFTVEWTLPYPSTEGFDTYFALRRPEYKFTEHWRDSDKSFIIIFVLNTSIVVNNWGTVVLNQVLSWQAGSKITLEVQGLNYKVYLNSTLLYSGASTSIPPPYPLALDVNPYRVAWRSSPSDFKITGVLEEAPYKPHWRNMINCSLDSEDNITNPHLLNGVYTVAWSKYGAYSVDSITGDGYVELITTNKALKEVVWHRQIVGLAPVDNGADIADSHYAWFQDIYYNNVTNQYCWDLYVYEKGINKFTYAQYRSAEPTTWAGIKLRVAIEEGVVKFRANGVLIYTSSTPPTARRYYVDYTSPDPNAKSSYIRMGSAGASATGWRIDHTGQGEFGSGVKIGGTNINAIKARVLNALDSSNRYRGNDYGAPLSSRILPNMVSLGNSHVLDSKWMYTEIIIDIPESTLTDEYANFDSISSVRVRLYSQCGELKADVEQPFAGRGKVSLGVHNREIADALEQAVYSIEFKNIYGWSRAYWWATPHAVAGIWAHYAKFTPGFSPPAYRARGYFTSNVNAVAVSSTSVVLSWTNSTLQSENTYWKLIRGRKADRTAARTPNWAEFPAHSSPSVTSHTISGLDPDTEYEFYIHGYDGWTHGQYIYVRTQPTPPFALSARPKPYGLSANVASQTQINISWGIQGTPDSIELFINGGHHTTVSGTTTSYAITGLSANSFYAIKIREAWNDGSKSEFCPEVSSATPPYPNYDPSNLSGYVRDYTAIELSWNQNDGRNTRVEYKTNYMTDWAVFQSNNNQGWATFWGDYSTWYYFRVFNETSGTVFSNTISVYTDPDPDPPDDPAEPEPDRPRLQ